MIGMPGGPPFSLRGLHAGAVGVSPLILSVGMYGVAFGIMAGAAGLSILEAVALSGWVNAGGAQMASLQAWADPVPIVAVCLTTLAMNARYLLLGATLRPWFGGLPGSRVYPSLFVLGDGNWALAMREYAQGRNDAAFLLGSGFVMWLTWVSSTAAGHAFGAILGRPERFGIDFMLAAFFAAMALDFYRTARGVLPLVVGVATAIVVERLVHGPWYILAGALAGSLAGAMRHVDAR
jgi:predicted branched-subunit amino acid permease